MADINKWIEVVNTPLGYSAFALFLIFSVLSKVVKREKHQTVTLVVFLSLAVVSLVGGIILAREQYKSPIKPMPLVDSHAGSVEITGNSGVVEAEIISTDVSIKNDQRTDSHAGSVGIKNNKGDVHVGEIKTKVDNN